MMKQKKKDKKIGRVASAVICFAGSLVCLFWSAVSFTLAQPATLGIALALGFLVLAFWCALKGIRKLRKPRKVVRKREGKWLIVWAFICLLLSGGFLYLGMRMVILNQSFGGLVVVILMCLVPAFIFGGTGISRIREMMDKPEKADKPGDGGRRWWPIRLLMFVGPKLFGVSAIFHKHQPPMKA